MFTGKPFDHLYQFIILSINENATHFQTKILSKTFYVCSTLLKSFVPFHVHNVCRTHNNSILSNMLSVFTLRIRFINTPNLFMDTDLWPTGDGSGVLPCTAWTSRFTVEGTLKVFTFLELPPSSDRHAPVEVLWCMDLRHVLCRPFQGVYVWVTTALS